MFLHGLYTAQAHRKRVAEIILFSIENTIFKLIKVKILSQYTPKRTFLYFLDESCLRTP